MNAQRLFLALAMSTGFAGFGGQAFGQASPRPDSQVAAARKVVTEAQTAVAAAKAQMDKIRVKVIATFKTATPDYVAAEMEATKARADMEREKLVAQNAARNKPDYKEAMAGKTVSQEKMRALGDAKGSEREREALLAEFTSYAGIVNRLEFQSLESAAKYIEAKAHYLEAQKTLEGFKTQIEEACAADPDHMAADLVYQAAQATLVTAVDAQKQVQKSEGEARAAETKARSDASKTKQPPR